MRVASRLFPDSPSRRAECPLFPILPSRRAECPLFPIPQAEERSAHYSRFPQAEERSAHYPDSPNRNLNDNFSLFALALPQIGQREVLTVGSREHLLFWTFPPIATLLRHSLLLRFVADD